MRGVADLGSGVNGEPPDGACIFNRSNLHVLLVDRDFKSRHEVLQLLRRCSYQVTAVETPRAALEVMTTGFPVHLMLAEVEFPKGKGLKMLRHITKQENLRQIPIVMMSTRDEMSVVVKCLSLGAADFLMKPLRINELLNLWTHMWRRQRMLGLVDQRTVSLNMNDSPADSLPFDASESNTGSTDLFSEDTEADRRRSGVSGNGPEVGGETNFRETAPLPSPALELSLKPCVPHTNVMTTAPTPTNKSSALAGHSSPQCNLPSAFGSAIFNCATNSLVTTRNDRPLPSRCSQASGSVRSSSDDGSPAKELLKESGRRDIAKVCKLTTRADGDAGQNHRSNKVDQVPNGSVCERSSSLPAPFQYGLPLARADSKPASLHPESDADDVRMKQDDGVPWLQQRNGKSGAEDQVAGSLESSVVQGRAASGGDGIGRFLSGPLPLVATPEQGHSEVQAGVDSAVWGRHANGLPVVPHTLSQQSNFPISSSPRPPLGEQHSDSLPNLVGHAGHFLHIFRAAAPQMLPPHIAAAAAAAVAATSPHLQGGASTLPQSFVHSVMPQMSRESCGLGLIPGGLAPSFSAQALAAAAAFGYLSPIAAAAAAAAAAVSPVRPPGVNAPGLPPTATPSAPSGQAVSRLPASNSPGVPWPPLQTTDRTLELSERREAALSKFRQKRKERCFEKKIRYASRKRLAEQRPRKRGQFVKQGTSGLTTKGPEESDEEDEFEDEQQESEDDQ